MTQGIYSLYFETNDYRYYIGYSIDIYTRYRKHCNDLLGNRHYNYKLQNAYNKILTLPTMQLIELVEDHSIIKDKEIYWIAEFDSLNTGFNLTSGGDGGGFGEHHYMSYYSKDKYIDLVKELANSNDSITTICKKIQFDRGIAYTISSGKAHQYLQFCIPIEYTKMLEKHGRRSSGLRTYEDSNIYESIFLDLVHTNLKHREICIKYGVKDTIVEGISSLDTHKYLENKFPKEYAILKIKVGNRTGKPRSGEEYPRVLDPQNIEHIVIPSAKAFAEANGLHVGHFGELLRGKAKTHKGWKLVPVSL